MQKTLLLALLALVSAEATAAQRQAPPGQTPGRTVTKRPDATPAPAPSNAQDKGKPAPQDKVKDEDAAARKEKEAATIAELRVAFGEEYYRRKQAASDEVVAARTRAGDDDAAFAAARTEIARKYRGELATLRTTYAEKARALGVTFTLPDDDMGLERAAAAAAPASALRVEFTVQVAALARAAQQELAVAQKATGSDTSAFAAKRTEIARVYRAKVVALQQSFAQRAAAQGVTVDTSDVAPVMGALAAAESAAPPQREPKPAPPVQPKPGTDADPGPAQPAARPIDAEVLRTAFTKQVDALRSSLASELATADATLKGDELAAKRTSIVQRYRTDLATYRANVAARAQAAGVTLTLPTDQELVPELTPPPVKPPKEAPKDGQQPPGTEAPPKGDGAAPPKDAPQPATGGKRGTGPRFGNGGTGGTNGGKGG